MTKKDYELFVNAIRNKKGLDWTFADVVDMCATIFKQENPLFKRDKFEQACYDYEGKHIRKAISGKV